ncbi:amidohydrolase [Shouchella lehensis]|uniref:Amidohydrolase n=1 Tax=Shouchella lehensis G1 TaxID=1246626 RepID=A0A060LZV6_9BACI|nr:amidohydrolase [Shouchella lehensis]AIC95305.1 amidohydrolase [Shouchella lehensis G1]
MGTLLYNAVIYTMELEGEQVEALYIEEGKIVDCGSSKRLLEKWSRQASRARNLNGAFIYPGFVDSHLHLIAHGQKLLRLDLSQSTKKDALAKLEAQSVQDGEWIEALGWNEHNDPDHALLTVTDLNKISINQPIFVMRICRHAAIVNQNVLDLAGIDRFTPDPKGGKIERDEHGNPNGILHDAAIQYVQAVMPPLSKASVKKALQTAINDCHAKGLTGGHSEDLHYYNGLAETVDIYQEVVNEKKPFRAHLLIHHEELSAYDASPYTQQQALSPYVEFGALKIFADGALGGRTAALSEPYEDDPSTSGLLIHNQTALYDLVYQARKRQLAVAIHVIGDQALELALTAIEQNETVNQRDRLIHVQVAREDLVQRMAKLPIVIDVQPHFVVSDFPWVEERLGEERMSFSFAWKTLLETGIHCAGGSDAPIEPIEPLKGMHAAIFRKNDQGTYNVKEALTPYEAVALFTTGSAYAIEKEATRGKVKIGYDADLTILDRDLFRGGEEAFSQARVLETIVNGYTVYEKGGVTE